jgi:hypothetical protein
MAMTHSPGKEELMSIARDAMLKRGLLPDFSPAVIASHSGRALRVELLERDHRAL